MFYIEIIKEISYFSYSYKIATRYYTLTYDFSNAKSSTINTKYYEIFLTVGVYKNCGGPRRVFLLKKKNFTKVSVSAKLNFIEK